MNLRLVSFVLALVAVGTLVFGTSGFTTMTADRSVSVDVVDDESAFVGYDNQESATTVHGSDVRLVEVMNRLPDSSLDIQVTEVDVDGAATGFSSVDPPAGDVPTGESDWVTATIDSCDTTRTATVQVTIKVEDTDVATEIYGNVEQREVELRCEGTVDAVRFGSADTTISPAGQILHVEAFYLAEGVDAENATAGDFTSESHQSFDTSSDSLDSDRLAAVRVYRVSNGPVTYLNEEYSVDSGDLPDS